MAQQYNGLAARIAAAMNAAGVVPVASGDIGMPESVTISSSTASAGPAPSVFTTSSNPMTNTGSGANGNHFLQIGDLVYIFLHTGNYELNGGPYVVGATGFTATTFSVTDLYGNYLYQNVGGSGGYVQSLGFGVTYQIPNDLDPSNAAAWNVAFQAIGDRTALLAQATGTVSVYQVAEYHIEPTITQLNAGQNIFQTPYIDCSTYGIPTTYQPASNPTYSGSFYPMCLAQSGYNNIGTSIAHVTDTGGRVQITTTANHGLITGQTVVITGVNGQTNANGFWTITVVGTAAFTLNASTWQAGYPGYNSATTTGYVSIPLVIGGENAATTMSAVTNGADQIEIDVSFAAHVPPGYTAGLSGLVGVALGYVARFPDEVLTVPPNIQEVPGTLKILPYSSWTDSDSDTNNVSQNVPVSLHGIILPADLPAHTFNVDFYLMAFSTLGSGSSNAFYGTAVTSIGGITATMKVLRNTQFHRLIPL